MRLVYLDEAGISNNGVENTLVVAGCIVDMDRQWRPLKREFESLVEKYVHSDERQGFVFHAKDIWHGANTFDRRTCSRDRRKQVLQSLCVLLAKLDVGIVFGFARKDELAATLESIGEQHDPKLIGRIAYMGAFVEAIDQANRWMERYAGKELCSVVIEDNNELRRLGKRVFEELRTGSVPQAVQEAIPNLPFEYVLDEPSYVRKAGAPVLQLADLCAFLLRRWLDGRSDVDEFLAPIQPMMIASRLSAQQLKAVFGPRPQQTGMLVSDA